MRSPRERDPPDRPRDRQGADPPDDARGHWRWSGWSRTKAISSAPAVAGAGGSGPCASHGGDQGATR